MTNSDSVFSESSPARARILLAEDDRAVRAGLTQVLEGDGYEVLPAADGLDAVEVFSQGEPDLVIVDLGLPRKNGWAVFEAMEAMHPMIPCIIITARPNQQRCALGHGVDVLMEKPLDMEVLLETVDRLLAEPRNDRVARMSQHEFQPVRIAGAGR
jgi:DNA-binding response OmpR family regulator